mmetsp:Transcript_22585/g.89375  ORF Transcript_22585/g.89375 Transcript_22585/m.89375 type:complete len:967 (-) Transcript_22585:48-2948(-)
MAPTNDKNASPPASAEAVSAQPKGLSSSAGGRSLRQSIDLMKRKKGEKSPKTKKHKRTRSGSASFKKTIADMKNSPENSSCGSLSPQAARRESSADCGSQTTKKHRLGRTASFSKAGRNLEEAALTRKVSPAEAGKGKKLGRTKSFNQGMAKLDMVFGRSTSKQKVESEAPKIGVSAPKGTTRMSEGERLKFIRSLSSSTSMKVVKLKPSRENSPSLDGESNLELAGVSGMGKNYVKRKVTAKSEWIAQDEAELNVKVGDVILIHSVDSAGWAEGSIVTEEEKEEEEKAVGEKAAEEKAGEKDGEEKEKKGEKDTKETKESGSEKEQEKTEKKDTLQVPTSGEEGKKDTAAVKNGPGWFPLKVMLPPGRLQNIPSGVSLMLNAEPESVRVVDDSSIVHEKEETEKKLQKLLEKRPEKKDLEDRNIVDANEDEATPIAKALERKKIGDLLTNIFSRKKKKKDRATPSAPTSPVNSNPPSPREASPDDGTVTADGKKDQKKDEKGEKKGEKGEKKEDKKGGKKEDKKEDKKGEKKDEKKGEKKAETEAESGVKEGENEETGTDKEKEKESEKEKETGKEHETENETEKETETEKKTEKESEKESGEKKEQSPLAIGVEIFNDNPGKGIKYFLEQNINIVGNTPDSIAKFLYKFTALDRVQLGDFLGSKGTLNEQILDAVLAQLDFTCLEFDMALRRFLYAFRLPGEAQKIDRLMLAFAKKFFDEHPDGKFADVDAVYILAFSVVMLNTDLHNPSIKRKMAVDQFISQNRGVNGGGNFPPELLTDIYDMILDDEIRDKEQDHFSDAIYRSWAGHCAGTGKRKYKRRWVVVDQSGFFILDNPNVPTSAALHVFMYDQITYIKDLGTAKGEFRLMLKNQEEHYFCAKTARHVKLWVAKVNLMRCRIGYLKVTQMEQQQALKEAAGKEEPKDIATKGDDAAKESGGKKDDASQDGAAEAGKEKEANEAAASN